MKPDATVKLSVIALIYIIGAGAAWYVFSIHFYEISKSLLVTGFLMSLPQLVNMVLSVPIGSLCDIFSKKKIIVFGFLPISLVALLFATNSVYIAFAAMLAYGFFYSFETIGMTAYLREHAPKGKIGATFGFFQSVPQIGWVIGPIAVSTTYSHSGLHSGFYIFSVTALVATIVSTAWLRESGKSRLRMSSIIPELKKRFRASFSLSVGINKLGVGIAVLIFISFLTGFWEYALWVTEPLIASAEYSSLIGGALVIGFSNMPFVIFGVFGGTLSDRLGRKPVIMMSLALSFVSILLFSITSDALLSMLLAFFASTGLALASPATGAFLTDIIPKERFGLISGWENTMYSLAGFLAPLVSGFLGLRSLRLPLLYTSFLVGISVLLIAFFCRKEKCHI